MMIDNIPQISSISQILSDDYFSYGGDGLSGNLNNMNVCMNNWDNIPDYLFDGIIEKYCAHGRRITDLPTTRGLQETDLFLTELSTTDAISYRDIVNSLKDDCENGLSLGTMAYESHLRYSLVNHKHDDQYTKLSACDITAPGQGIPVLKVTLRENGSIPLSDANVVTITLPEYEIKDLPRPEIGTLKFVYHQEGDTLWRNRELIEDADFDGWLYPNGQTLTVYDTTKFAQAISCYGSGNSFTLPNLNGFFKPSPRQVQNISTVHPYVLGLKNHTHNVKSMPVSGSLKTNENVSWPNYTNPFRRGKNASHIHSGVMSRDEHSDITINLTNQKFPDLSCSYSGDDGKFEPQHIILPVMIYVGGV